MKERKNQTAVLKALELWRIARAEAAAGPAAGRKYLQLFKENEQKHRLLTELILLELGDAALEPALGGLCDENRAVRDLCRETLLEIRPRYAAIRARLLEAVADAACRMEALEMLGKLGEPDLATLKTLAGLVREKDPVVRGAAARALARIGKPVKPKGSLAYWTGQATYGLRLLRRRARNRVAQEEADAVWEAWHGAARFRSAPPYSRAYWRAPGYPPEDSAVHRALVWLAAHQHPRGVWDCENYMISDPSPQCTGGGRPEYDVGVTGLALLAFLRANYTDRPAHENDAFAPAVRRGLLHLMATQDEEGCFGPRDFKTFLYNHAIATLALCDACLLTRNPLYRKSAQRGLDFIETARNPGLAWRYGVRAGDNDTSITVWMVQALASGRRAGLRTDAKAFEGARLWVEKMTDPDFGIVGYIQPGGTPSRPEGLHATFPAERSQSMTAAGILIRLLCGAQVDQRIEKGAERCVRVLPTWEEPARDMYYWYAGTLALVQLGRVDPLNAWGPAVRKTITEHQRADGHERGSWDPSGVWGRAGGRVYSTALLASTLLALDAYER
jgi:hypothetical protein